MRQTIEQREHEVIKRYRLHQTITRIQAMTGFTPKEIYDILTRYQVAIVPHSVRAKMRHIEGMGKKVHERLTIGKMERRVEGLEREKRELQRRLDQMENDLRREQVRWKWRNAGVEV